MKNWRAPPVVAPNDDLTAIFSKHLKIYGSTLGSREEFRQLLSFMAVKKIKPIVDSVFPLKDTAAAQRHLEEAKQFSKVVLDIFWARFDSDPFSETSAPSSCDVRTSQWLS
jgi:NADPH:quinone reductase-like Zn-dependent oxidoreductase